MNKKKHFEYRADISAIKQKGISEMVDKVNINVFFHIFTQYGEKVRGLDISWL